MKNQSKPSVTLALIHNIYLTKQERHHLHLGKTQTVVGVQVPVWHQRGRSSEPAVEIFCRYVLHNDPEMGTEIKQSSWGYEFNVPQLKHDDTVLEEIDNDTWRKMTLTQKELYYQKYPDVPSSKKLLDPKDGGSGRINFNQQAIQSVNSARVNVLHYVRIESMDSLINSIL